MRREHRVLFYGLNPDVPAKDRFGDRVRNFVPVAERRDFLFLRLCGGFIAGVFMSDEPKQPKEPDGEGKSSAKISWLFFAFLPSVIAIICFKTNSAGLFPALLILNLFCSMISSFGLIRGIKNKFAAFFVGLFLVLFFLLVNTLIAVFIGCSTAGGRIAP